MTSHAHTPVKRIVSTTYNLLFDRDTGLTLRWGRTLDDDPPWSPLGPEILDIEISTVCSGVGTPCTFCYKSNRPTGRNMALATYRRVLAALPTTVTQVALGIGDLDGNPDLRGILEATRRAGLVPNLTTSGAGLTDRWAQTLATGCGAVAVSLVDPYTTLTAIRRLLRAGLRQVNLQCLLTPAMTDALRAVLTTVRDEPELRALHAVVLLAPKPKGRARRGLPGITDDDLARLVAEVMDLGVGVGFDSCSAPRARIAMRTVDISSTTLDRLIEPCEAGCFSSYVNVDGRLFPCSFLEGEPGWETGLDLLGASDFLTDLWSHPRLVTTRHEVVRCRQTGTPCPRFDLAPPPEVRP